MKLKYLGVILGLILINSECFLGSCFRYYPEVLELLSGNTLDNFWAFIESQKTKFQVHIPLKHIETSDGNKFQALIL